MRKIILVLVCIGFASSVFSQESTVGLSLDEKKVIDRLKNIALEFVNAKNAKELPKLDSLVADKNFLKRYEKITYEQTGNSWYANNYGLVTSLDFVEILESNKNRKIVRFRKSYSETSKKSELRFILNRNHKMVGLISKIFWSDTVYKYGEEPPLVNVNKNQVDKEILKENKLFIEGSLKKCDKTSQFPLNRENMTFGAYNRGFPKRILKGCASIKEEHGDVYSFRLYEVLTDKFTRTVYRYRGAFTENKDNLEIRVIRDLENKFSGLWVVKWVSDYVKAQEL